MITLISVATFVSTLLGGLFALKFKSKLYLILGFSAGAVIGIALFDLLPTAIELSVKTYSTRQITAVMGWGFIIYLALDRLVIFLNKKQDQNSTGLRGKIAAFCLTLHSFLDGVAIGLAFHVSAAIGSLVATAVIVHDFADGINTTNVILKEKGNRKHVIKWLFINAIAPVAGAYSTVFYQLPEAGLGVLLALVSGFFLYIGASDFLPESQHNYPGLSTSLMTIIGVVTLYIVIQISGA